LCGPRCMHFDLTHSSNFSSPANKEHWDELAESEYLDCGEGTHNQDCLTFDVNQLCTHYEADHNYYAACRNMLSSYADGRKNGGAANLLHDISEYDKVTALYL